MSDEKITETKPFHEQQVLWPLMTGYTILYLAMMVADFALRDAFTIQAINPTFKLPDDLSKVCLQVLGIFFGSKISGNLYSMKQEAKDFETEAGGREDKILALVTEKGAVTVGARGTASRVTCRRLVRAGCYDERKHAALQEA